MKLPNLTPAQGAVVLDALGAVATAQGTTAITDADRAVLEAAARHLLGGVEVPLEPATKLPADLTDVLPDEEDRQLAMHIAAVLCFADITTSADAKQGYLDPARVAAFDELGQLLELPNDDIVELQRLTRHHRVRVEYDLFRRFVTGTYGESMTITETTMLQTEAKLGIHDRDIVDLWHRTERLPEGTVGAELVRYYQENGWKYPGTDHHQPLMFAVHDFHHVLGGYPTTPGGELGVGAFTAGVAARPMDCALFFLMWEQLGLGSRAIPGAVGAFEAEPFFAALERGTRTTQNFIGDDWDPWTITDMELAAARERYQIGPGGPLAPGDPYHQDPPSTTSS